MFKTLKFPSVALLLVVVSLASEAPAQQSGQYTLRTYEVGDLTVRIRDRPYAGSASSWGEAHQFDPGRVGGGGFGDGNFGGGGGAFSIPDSPVRVSVAPAITLEGLIDTILTTVEPNNWTANGASDGQISAVGTALVVRQQPPVHAQIEGLLKALRGGSANRHTLTIDARWLMLTSDELQRLQPEGGRIDRDALETLTRRGASIRGVTKCFSGQLVYLVSGTRRNDVASYIPVVGSLDSPADVGTLVSQQSSVPARFASDSGAGSTPQVNPGVGYQPVITTTNLGALLEVRATHSLNGKVAVVDLKSTITAPSQDTLPPRGVLGAPSIDRVAIETQQFATTMRVALGEPTLVGGMTFFPSSVDSDGERAQLYLVLEVR